MCIKLQVNFHHLRREPTQTSLLAANRGLDVYYIIENLVLPLSEL